jgi:hypothetical protein
MRLFSNVNDNNASLCVYYTGAIVWAVIFQYKSLEILDKSQKSVFMLRMPNMTSIEPDMYCDIPYNDCRCSVISTKYCVTDTHLKISRVVPLLLFLLHIYLIREAFSLSGDYIYFFVYLLWITTIIVI